MQRDLARLSKRSLISRHTQCVYHIMSEAEWNQFWLTKSSSLEVAFVSNNNTCQLLRVILYLVKKTVKVDMHDSSTSFIKKNVLSVSITKSKKTS